MRRFASWLWFTAVALTSACGQAGDRAAGGAGTDTTAAASPASTSTPAIVTVLYNTPKDTAAFERYYRATHVPLVVANQGEIGFVRADLTRFVSTADGKKPTFYRQAELYFNSMEELRKGIATPGFKKVADDLPKFATGGLTGMIASASEPHGENSGTGPAAIVTVIYKMPKDSAAFEKYYADTHLPLVTTGKNQIGFERAELTKFTSNLDGSAPGRYRQAELYFASMDALRKGIGTPAFQRVAGDLSNFATGGFDALIAMETR
jgi:uncharacterized protein (TIGR02118 family)